jgi:hypothetical protein
MNQRLGTGAGWGLEFGNQDRVIHRAAAARSLWSAAAELAELPPSGSVWRKGWGSASHINAIALT